MRKHVLYAVAVFMVAYWVYLDEVRTRMYPWAYDITTNQGEQITLIRADVCALVVCAILAFTPVMVYAHYMGKRRSR